MLLALPFQFSWFAWVTEGNQSFWAALAYLAFIEVTALLFNLIPVPPLDGFGIVAPWLPLAIVEQMYRLGNMLFFVLLMIFWQDNPIVDAFWSEAFRIADMIGIPLFLVDIGWDQLFVSLGA